MLGAPIDDPRLRRLRELTRACVLCSNRCGVDRGDDEAAGACGAAQLAEIAHAGPHFGEEPPLTGERGCGNIFFSHCNLTCVYCQNWQISQGREVPARSVGPVELADLMLRLQDEGVHTVGLVSPTPHLPVVVPALLSAKARGLRVPVVYNTNAYETLEALEVLDGLVDIYLPDLKYGTDQAARVYSGVAGYVSTSRAAVQAMVEQAGHLRVGPDGIATGGVLVRHLVLPGDRADTTLALTWLARTFGPALHLSLMSQYNPCHLVEQGFFPELARPLEPSEYRFVLDFAAGLGLENLFTQEGESRSSGNPDFCRREPFAW
ncbi:MAG: radical SAM protein [Deltaproteobacteria bacterium]|nr:radical SAM protein [Deltaproteobacteria bacterium]